MYAFPSIMISICNQITVMSSYKNMDTIHRRNIIMANHKKTRQYKHKQKFPLIIFTAFITNGINGTEFHMLNKVIFVFDLLSFFVLTWEYMYIANI